jgi:hypothetical protein
LLLTLPSAHHLPYTQLIHTRGPPHSYFASMPWLLTSFCISPVTLSHNSTLPAPMDNRTWPWVSRLRHSCCSFFHCTTCMIYTLCYYRCTPRTFWEHMPSHGPPTKSRTPWMANITTPLPPLLLSINWHPAYLSHNNIKASITHSLSLPKICNFALSHRTVI